MEVQAVVVSESELSHLASESGLQGDTIMFTTTDGLTFDLASATVAPEFTDSTIGDECGGINQQVNVNAENEQIHVISEDHGSNALDSVTFNVSEINAMTLDKTANGIDDVGRLFTAQLDETTDTRLMDIGATRKIVVGTVQQLEIEEQHRESDSPIVAEESTTPDNVVPVDKSDDLLLDIRQPVDSCESNGPVIDDKDVNDKVDGGEDESNMVVIDISKPIELSQNSLIVVNGQRCVLQQNRETGQLIAYPVKEPDKPQRKRGRPKKSNLKSNEVRKISELDVDENPVISASDEVNIDVEEEHKEKGFVEMANEVGEIVKRSARKRKKVVLKEYEMGKIKIIESDDEDPVNDKEDNDDPLPKKKRALPRQNVTKVTNSVISDEKVVRKRGRPRRYPVDESTKPTQSSDPPPDTHSFLIQMVDGQTMMMQVPFTSIPDGVSLQNIAQSIAESLNTSKSTSTSVDQSSLAVDILKNNAVEEPDVATLQPLESMESINFPCVVNSTTISSDEFNTRLLPSSSDQISIVHSLIEENPIQSSVINNEPTQTLDEFRIVSTDSMTGVEAEANPETGIDSQTNLNSDDVTKGDVLRTFNNDKSIATKSAQTIIQPPKKRFNLIVPDTESPIHIGLRVSSEDLEKLFCAKCDFQAYYSMQFQEHLATHPDIHKCKCCGELSITKDQMINHVKSQHPQNICSVCNYISKRNRMLRHMSRHDVTSVACEICGKMYKDIYILRVHKKNVHFPAEIVFHCSVCSKTFTRKAHLKRHLRTHVPEMKRFQCDVCEYRSCERADIVKHQLTHHEPKYACDVCGVMFRHLKNKELHLKRHYGQRNYKCGVCDFYSYTFTDVRKHIERRHTEPKTILCNKCGQAFKTNLLLKAHIKSDQCELLTLQGSPPEPEVDSLNMELTSNQMTTISINDCRQNDADQQPVANEATDRLSSGEVTMSQVTFIDSKSLDLSSAITSEGIKLVAASNDVTLTVVDDRVNISEKEEHLKQYATFMVNDRVISGIICMQDASEFCNDYTAAENGGVDRDIRL